MKKDIANSEKQQRREFRLKWIRKNGWIVQTIVSSIALIISIIARCL